MNENELKLLERIKMYPKDLSHLTEEEINISIDNLKKSIQNYFNYCNTHKLTNHDNFFQICIILFNRFINAYKEDNNDWPFLKEAYNKDTLINNELYRHAFTEQIKRLTYEMTDTSIQLITDELVHLKEEIKKYQDDIPFIYNIKLFLYQIHHDLTLFLGMDAIDTDDTRTFAISDGISDILIDDITLNNTISISEEYKEKLIAILRDIAINCTGQNDEEFTIICNSILNLAGEKELTKLIKDKTEEEEKLKNRHH